MTRKILALTTAAALGFGAAAASAQSMDMGYNMLTGAVYQMLRQRDLPTDNINDLTLNELAQIKGVLDGGDSEGQKNQRIREILTETDR